MLHASPIFSVIFEAMQWLMPLLLLVMFVMSPLFRGLLGKWLVDLAVKLQLDSEEYHLIRNVVLPGRQGTFRIDHVIVSRYGLFVVDTNLMHGRIYGGRGRNIWIRKIHRTRQPFENPNHRSFRHADALAATLGVEASRLFPLVVFAGDCTFKTPMPANVIHGGGYIRYIESKTKELLDEAEVASIIRQVESLRQEPSIKIWVERARQVLGFAPAKPVDKVCPRCGGAMVLHASKKFDEKGQQFWGCASFPECKGILDVTQIKIPRLKKSRLVRGSGIIPSGA